MVIYVPTLSKNDSDLATLFDQKLLWKGLCWKLLQLRKLLQTDHSHKDLAALTICVLEWLLVLFVCLVSKLL